MTKRLIELILVTVIFLVLTVILFYSTITSDKLLALRDLGRFFYPIREYAFGLIKHGILPLWNPYILCGTPLIAAHQAAVFYPLSAIYLCGSFINTFNNFIYLHFMLAGLLMYIFLKDQGLSVTASFIGSASFAFSGFLFAAVNVLTFFSSAIWLPIVLWSLFRAEKTKKLRDIVLTSVLLLFMFLAGEPMVFYMTSIIIVLYSLRSITLALKVLSIFLLLSAFQLFPMTELLMMSDRTLMSYPIATKWSMAPYNFLDLLFPCITNAEALFKGYWEKQSWLLSYYMGILPVIILPISVFMLKGRRKNLTVLMLAVSVILALGSNTPIYGFLFRFLPGFKFFRYPVKYFYITTFSLAWLCAMGFDYYEKNAKTDPRMRKLVRGLLYSTLFVGIALFFIHLHYKDCVDYFNKIFFMPLEKSMKEGTKALPFVELEIFTIRRTLIFFVVFAVLLFMGTKKKVRAGFATFAIALIVLADILSSIYDINVSVSKIKFKESAPNIDFLKQDKELFRFISGPANDYFTIDIDKRYIDKGGDYVGKERLYPDRMMEFGLYDVNGYEAASQIRTAEVISFIISKLKYPNDSRLLDALNAKYIITPKTLNLDGYKLVKKSDIAGIYESKSVLPRAFLSDKAVVRKDVRQIFHKFSTREWDPTREVILEEAPVPSHKGGPTRSVPKAERVEIIRYSPNEVIVRAALTTEKFLVISDSFYPGWHGYVDGAKVRIYRANYFMRAVCLGPGEHEVRFVFWPLSFELGLTISFSAVIILLYYIVIRRK